MSGAAKRCAEQDAFGFRQLDGIYISVQVFIQIVMTGHFMLLSAFFMQPYPGATALHIDIFDLYPKCRTNAGKCIDHQAN